MSEHVKKFFDYMQLPEFDVAADAATTFKVMFSVYSLSLSLPRGHALLVYGILVDSCGLHYWCYHSLLLNVTPFDFGFHFSQISIV